MTESLSETPNLPINDPDKCHTKWMPLTKGMDERAAYLAAWAMEHEAKSLQKLTASPETKAQVGPMLKYMFPTIRRVFAGPTVLDEIVGADDREVLTGIFHGLVKTSCEAILEIDAGYSRPGLEVNSDDLLNHEVMIGLAGRLADATLCYPWSN